MYAVPGDGGEAVYSAISEGGSSVARRSGRPGDHQYDLPPDSPHYDFLGESADGATADATANSQVPEIIRRSTQYERARNGKGTNTKDPTYERASQSKEKPPVYASSSKKANTEQPLAPQAVYEFAASASTKDPTYEVISGSTRSSKRTSEPSYELTRQGEGPVYELAPNTASVPPLKPRLPTKQGEGPVYELAPNQVPPLKPRLRGTTYQLEITGESAM